MATKNLVDTTIDCQSANDGMTRQSFKDECDINYIVKKAQTTGLLNNVNTGVPQYVDVSNIPNYQEALNIVNQANELFGGLDAFVRERFGNDPGNMIQFIEDDKNYDEALKLGLINPPAEKPESSETNSLPTK